MLGSITRSMTVISLLLSGAIFGFFYAWVCSTMWGLDNAAPQVAISAMQAMNASVRNMVFAPAFFGTPIVMLVTAGLILVVGLRRPAFLFAFSAVLYIVGCFLVTMTINVPMNEALALVEISTHPADPADARLIWETYSGEWQFWNQLRTVIAGISFGVAILAARDAARGGV